ncbi:UBP-type zinc finger domain-containing protein [Williamsia soli]|uniref:UBP-type zinc finger domain-containing protein n=1 Tax=Williamsia soli TaxID=364929 RepID=UPI003555CCB5
MHRNIKDTDVRPDDDLCVELRDAAAVSAQDAATDGVEVCEDCAAEGVDHWAHLRRCLACGHVACCDSSPRKHATAHFKATGHPVMQSAEPGETWRWCYVHARMD